MIEIADLILPSQVKCQVELHRVKSDSFGRIHNGMFKNTLELSAQLTKEAELAGSWRDIREMKIEMVYRNVAYKLPILVDVPVQEFGAFQVIGDNEA
ncbi:hypothetical protein P0F40_003505 [Vibrio metschnikovii]|uniref:Uncharacterized protein n=3 Tax=Unclassified Bacteria TaxID=49928 RepID=A0AAU6TP75_UNCXX|nr:hypothetical protein [Vibrio metschnikovii]EKO3594321.1 hypothetical protein [Vibrio metschnikovii]EKO3643188.1 hypothetical protein [Vibrio metschnikovii]EKO3667724.1 hypothetical protein [Vibrio metschnikovii]EKO3698821.1 hypothetical protein [Vibrio metschnikovii]